MLKINRFCQFTFGLFLVMLLTTGCDINAQTIETLPLTGLDGPNGFALDKKGRLYIANEKGKRVVVISHDKEMVTAIHSDSPNGVAFDSRGRLHVINFNSGTILRKRTNALDTLVVGLKEPSDIKWHGNAFYVSEYQTGHIKKINEQGQVTLFAEGIDHPFGLAFDKDGSLYVASNVSGEVIKISPEGIRSIYAKVPGVIAYLAYDANTGRLYIPCYTCNRIYFIAPNQPLTYFAGKEEPGDKDGELSSALFDGPNSIAVTPQGEIYISEYNVNRVRKIKFSR